jgi:kynurenine 3-monooxygenase
VSRAALNLALIKEAAKHRGVSLHFDVSAVAVDTVADTLTLRASTGRERKIALTPSIAADGGGSAVRLSLANAGLLVAREALLDHDYKELTIPAVQGMPALDPAALHIWPRGGFMLIALPNPDHSFTATLFLARHGDPGFNSLDDADSVRRFFDRYLPDTRSLMPSQVSEFLDHPQGLLGTIRCDRWHVGGQVLLLGDAAHAIVPFHGQGANCAFEDCLELAALLDPASGHSDASVEEVFALFQQRRQANANAIAEMALENYTEMRDTVRDERFQRLKLLSLDLERRHPLRFIPRYSMVMFHAEIPNSGRNSR